MGNMKGEMYIALKSFQNGLMDTWLHILLTLAFRSLHSSFCTRVMLHPFTHAQYVTLGHPDPPTQGAEASTANERKD